MDTHTPGMSVAIVRQNGPEWVAGLGKADVATGRPATADTLFRIGSTSKAFVSLAVLKLVNEGKLSLDDPVHRLAPEVWFENRWEASDPVRVVHLLEHTTGWDDMHLREYAKDAPNTGLRVAFDYDHHSRISRWRPGTRMAYCNSGPPVAAYIVEKITGERFEDYIQKNLFEPIGMRTATYFQPPNESAATLYHDDGKTPYHYWNFIYRPSGSINAFANDMANYVYFYLNRGAVNGVQVLPASSIERMESPTSTWAAREGLKAGYGLSNYWTTYGGFVYHGHNGGLDGGLTDMGYMPDHGVGFFYSINSGSTIAFQKVGKLIRAYITRGLEKPALPAIAPLPANVAEYSGWYELASPRDEIVHFLDRLLGMIRLTIDRDRLRVMSIGGSDVYLAAAGRQFRKDSTQDPPSPIATLALLIPNQEGEFIQLGAGLTMMRIFGWFAVSEILITVFVVLGMISVLIYAPFWLLGGLSGKRRRPAERAMRAWPLMAVLSLVGVVVVFMMTADDLIDLMGNLTNWSAAVFFLTIVFAAASTMSAVALWRANRKEVRRSVHIYSSMVTLALLIATVYLAYWGVIGLRTWA